MVVVFLWLIRPSAKRILDTAFDFLDVLPTPVRLLSNAFSKVQKAMNMEFVVFPNIPRGFREVHERHFLLEAI